MAIKKPLVISTGQVEQLQEGDVVEHIDLMPVTSIFGAGPEGQAVIWHSTGPEPGVDLGRADDEATARVVGIFSDANNNLIQMEGRLTLPEESWDLVNGSLGGLTPGAAYYLSTTVAGALVTTPPTADGHFVVGVGVAVNETTLIIRIQEPIGL
jgi:hypothetical protein